MASSLLTFLGTYLVMVVGTQAGILQFGLMVNCLTKRLPFTSYAFYGCHCGIGGSGWPVDEIDWCCRIHDCCYDLLLGKGCSPLFQNYDASCINETITCDDEDLEGCANRSCECDRAASYCFQQFNDRYSVMHNKNYYRENCSGAPPPC